MSYVDVILYCENVSKLGSELRKHPEAIITEDDKVIIHKNVIGAYYNREKSVALIRCKPEEVEYLESIKGLEILAQDSYKGDVYEKLKESDIIKIRNVIPETIEIDGEKVENPYRFGQYQ